MSSSIWALFINPGDQYSSEESLQDGIFQKCDNAKVVHANKQKKKKKQEGSRGGGGRYLRLYTYDDRLKMTLIQIFQEEIWRAVQSCLNSRLGSVKSPMVRIRKLCNPRIGRETSDCCLQQECHRCYLGLVSPRRTTHICTRSGKG